MFSLSLSLSLRLKTKIKVKFYVTFTINYNVNLMPNSATAARHKTVTTTLKQFNSHATPQITTSTIFITYPGKTSSLSYSRLSFPILASPFSIFYLIYIPIPVPSLFISLCPLSVHLRLLSPTHERTHRHLPQLMLALWWRKMTIPAGICPHVECKIIEIVPLKTWCEVPHMLFLMLLMLLSLCTKCSLFCLF